MIPSSPRRRGPTAILDSFFSALSFLTILRPRQAYTFTAEGAVYSFGYVGLLIGLGLALIHLIAGSAAPMLMVIYLAVITGFLHMDGLADTFDALFSHRDRATMLSIMKDSRVGPMGAAAIVLCFLAKFSAFSHIDNLWLLIAIPSLARCGMAVAAGALPYARADGLGKGFVSQAGNLVLIQFIPAQLILLIFCGGFIWLWVNVIFFVVMAGVLSWYRVKIGGITGDLLGALNEILETALFLLLSVL